MSRLSDSEFHPRLRQSWTLGTSKGFLLSRLIDTYAFLSPAVIMSVLLFIEHSVEVAHGKSSCKFSKTGYLRIAELVSSFLLITMLFIISLSLLVGVVKNREKYLLPFLSLQIMDFLLCLLTLLGSYIELPAYLKFASRSSRRVNPSKVPLMTLQLLDFCLSILTLCSSYMEVPTYLNFKSMNHMNYLPSQDGMTHNQFIKVMIIFSIAFITVLILKVYMFKCVWRCYRLMKCTNSAEERSGSKMLQKASSLCLSQVVLPSYEEAVSLPYKVPEGGPAPPPYSEMLTMGQPF
uniref:Lysosomal protein transmembrane 5 n=1 Tax=Capra hircus TaxID=9925 RepID=A0A8C2NL61_CAPHI